MRVPDLNRRITVMSRVFYQTELTRDRRRDLCARVAPLDLLGMPAARLFPRVEAPRPRA